MQRLEQLLPDRWGVHSEFITIHSSMVSSVGQRYGVIVGQQDTSDPADAQAMDH
jgi:hypothetical protein